MKIRPIKNQRDHEKALKRVEELWDSRKTKSDKDEFEVLFTLIEKFEEQHYPIGPPSPIEAIKFAMEQSDLKRSDLIKLVGHKSRVSEILKGKRKLTLPMIRSLSKHLKIPAEVLIKEY